MRISSNSHGPNFIFWLIENPWAIIVFSALTGTSLSFILGYNLLSCVGLSIALPFVFFTTLISYFIYCSYTHDGGSSNWNEYFTIKGIKYNNQRIPMTTFVESFIDGNVVLFKPLHDIMLHRNELFRFCFTWSTIKFYIGTFIFQNLNHSQSDDQDEIAHVYNRGNDFYGWFLGPTMIYTSGIYLEPDNTLEEAQRNKLDYVCDQLQLSGSKEGHQHLDIGCGWGTLAVHIAREFGIEVDGVTLSKEQCEHGYERAETSEVKVNLMVKDYRDLMLTGKKYDTISCLEMAEHVGIVNFQAFLQQVRLMLKDDGIFYLQIAGLRRAWQYSDLVWGVYMVSSILFKVLILFFDKFSVCLYLYVIIYL